ncbi:hypothetical protein ACSBR1_037859 [Camellia fascicularis]
MSATMADDQQHLLWRENRGDDDDNKMSDFPQNLMSYVNNNQFHCDRGIFNRGFVFSTLQQHHPPSQPPPFSKIIDLDSETPIAANRELIGKIKSIMKWIVFCPGQFLVQFWKVIEIEGRRLLTTQDQPFGLSTTHEGLCSYRLISLNYQFYVDGESEADPGLPGRVFRHRRPESSPNVQYYSCKEYPQRDHDVISKVRRSWALPVLESSGQCCVGVLELVAAAEPKYPFINLIDGIYKRVEEVGLRSSETCNHLYNKHKHEDEALKDALAEIKKVLIEVCKSHDLPLAQTWVPCRLCNPAVAGGSFNVSCREHLMSRFDIACCRDKDKLPFVDVCTLHSLGKGQGVVGKAFSCHNLVFCKDITQFSIIEYPLAHYACKYGLTGCFSICLRSSYTGDNVYMLEFFLRPSNTEGGDPRIALVPLLTTLKQHFRSFRVASGEELGEELCVEVIDSSKEDKLDSFQIPQIARSPDMMKNGGEMDYLDLSDQQLIEEDVIDTRNNVVCNTEINNIVVTSSQQKCIINSPQRQQRKEVIPISFEDIQQHVGMKLDDAAASLHDSQSTLKRACSEYDITGWSCRKRNKDNLSLSNKFVEGVAQEQIQESSQPPISDPPRKQDLATTCTKVHSMATQDTSIVTIKAKHGENFIKFKLPVVSGMVEFQQEVAKRLHLEDGTYSVKYQDDGNNWILIACDEELQDYISKSKSLGKNIVTMSLEPNYDKFVQDAAQEQIRESSQPPIFDPPRKQDLATTCAKVDSMATQDTSIVTIKAKHGENFIKFKLPVLSGIVEFQQEVAKRLHLEDGTYSVKYQDDGNNWILIARDEELRDYISKSKSLGKNIVTMSLEPNYDKFVQDAAQEQIRESSQPPIFDPPRKQDLATTCAKVHSMATQDTSIVTIKAKHGENFIKFKLPVVSGMVEFQQEVAKRLRLEDGTYSVKYQDDGNNWILIARDEELRDYISKSKSLGKNIVTMSLEPNYDKFVQDAAQEQIRESSQPPISDPPRKQDLATTCAKVDSMATQDTSIVTIKAKHGENFIKFKHPVLSGMVEFQQEVAKRLHLEDGTYSVKYQDDGNNWILIARDEELRDYISKSKSLGKNIVTMSLEPNYDKFVQDAAQEQIRESSQPPISDPPRKQDLATTCAKVHSMATQDTSIVTIKAKHGENFIKFKLLVVSGMVEFQQEVAKRLHLEDGTYNVKYQDDDNNWILIARDEELRDYISKSKSLGKNIVTMSLEPNYDKFVQDAAQEQIRESSQPPISDPPRKQDLATTCAKVDSMATQDTSIVTIKAKHGENFIKFKLPVLSGMVEFQQEVAKRLHLEDGTYSVKYQDDGNNWILIARDEELRDYISKSKSLGKNIVTMSLEPNYDKFVQDAAQEQIRESSQPPIFDPPRKQDLATTCAKVHSMATQDTSIVTIKAKHGENFIKFKLPMVSGMVEFQQEVAKRLHLEVGTYSVKYQDDGNNWILIARDEELRDYISKSKSLGKNIVTMLLQPITSCPP